MTGVSSERAAPAWRARAAFAALCITALAGGAVLGCGDLPYPYIHVPVSYRLDGVGVTLLIAAVLCGGSLRARVPVIPRAIIVPGCLAAVLTVQWAAVAWWPNSADEYGYTFLARTLLHGRLYNPIPPVRDLFDFAWIFVRDGKWFSQYAPGFSLLLAPLLGIGAGFLLNPLLAALLAALMLATVCRLGVAREAAACFTCLLVFSPFTLFNGAALFPHMLCAVAVVGIVYAQTRDDARTDTRNRIAIGVLFSILLLTRYEVFAITAGIYGASLTLRYRWRLLRHGWPIALGGLPGAAFFLIYNAVITKRPFRTPYAWSSNGAGYGLHAIGDRGLNTQAVALERSLQWGTELLAYTSAILVLLVGVALIMKLRTRRLRYYDLLFPATLLFFFFFANTGGHRFGPRYWYFAWPTAMLTLATALSDGRDTLRVYRWRLHLPTLTALHLAAYVGLSAVIAVNFSRYVAVRRQVYSTQPPQLPAIVLIPSRYIELSNHQTRPTKLGSADFPRNGVDIDGPVLYGRADDGSDSTDRYLARACSMVGRHVYVWREKGRLDEVDCFRKESTPF